MGLPRGTFPGVGGGGGMSKFLVPISNVPAVDFEQVSESIK